MKKSYLIAIIPFILGIGCFIIYSLIGSHVAQDGTLIEPFGLIPIGLTLFVVGILLWFVISIYSLFHTPNKTDKWIFGGLLIGSTLLGLYLFASMSYLTERANEEISQNNNQIIENNKNANVTYEDFIGSWVEPIPGNEREFQGFTLNADGSAESINLATLLYKKWKLSEDKTKIILTEESIGNHTSSTDDYTYDIVSVEKDKLIIKDEELLIIYSKK